MIRLCILYVFQRFGTMVLCSEHLKAKNSAQMADNEMKGPRVWSMRVGASSEGKTTGAVSAVYDPRMGMC